MRPGWDLFERPGWNRRSFCQEISPVEAVKFTRSKDGEGSSCRPLTLAEQRRTMRSLESVTGHLKDKAGSLTSNLAAGLTSGDFRPGREDATA